MSDAFWQHLPLVIAAIGVAIPAIIAAVAGVRNSRKMDVVHDKMAAVEKATNGMKDALIIAERKDAKQEGRAQGVIEGRAEQQEGSK